MEAGGAQHIAWTLTQGFASRGHESKLMFLYTKRPVYPEGEDVVSLYAKRPGPIGFILTIRRMLSMIRQYQPHAIIAHTHYANVLVLPLAWIMRVPIRVAVQHNPSSSYPTIARWLDRLLGATAVYSCCVLVSEAIRGSFLPYSNVYRKKMHVILNGIHVAPKSVEPAAPPFERDIPLLLNVGRLSHQKQQATLINIVERIPDVGLIIIGEGELRDSLEQLISERGLSSRVRLMGEHSHDVVWSYLKSAQVFVFTSRYEGLSVALGEAICAGLPVVASDISQNREALTTLDGRQAGILVDPEDIDAYVHAIQCILSDPKRARALSLLAKQRAGELDVNIMIDTYEACLAKAGKMQGQRSLDS
jgi:glycosyltransferase involved in cell wall biosynthesis